MTFVTSADTAMVNALERILNRKIDRQLLEGFDYAAPAPPEQDAEKSRQLRPARITKPFAEPEQPEKKKRGSV